MFVFIAQLQRIGLLPSHFPTQVQKEANNLVSDQQPDTWQNSSQSYKQCFFIHITGYKEWLQATKLNLQAKKK